MKHIYIFITLIIILALGIWVFSLDTTEAPGKDGETEPASEEIVLQDGQYAVATSSRVYWEGSKPLLANYSDAGYFEITDGSLVVASSTVASGSFDIDVDSLIVTETGVGTGEDSLRDHLKSSDFFGVEEYPMATFEVVSSEDGAVVGNLTMKEITETISIPVSFVFQEGKIVMIGQTTIDRTRWGITYNSPSFFQNLGENIIADEVIVNLEVILENVS